MLEIGHGKRIPSYTNPLICCATCRKHPITVRDLELSATNALVLEIILETGDNIPTAVRRGLRQVRGFEMIQLDLYLSLNRIMSCSY